MRQGDKPPSKAPPIPIPPQVEKAEEAEPVESAFDVWLNRGLHQLFDDVANEPVPAALLKLIQENKKK